MFYCVKYVCSYWIVIYLESISLFFPCPVMKLETANIFGFRRRAGRGELLLGLVFSGFLLSSSRADFVAFAAHKTM